MNEPGIIPLRGNSKRYGTVVTVENIDLEIERGDFFRARAIRVPSVRGTRPAIANERLSMNKCGLNTMF